MQRPVSPRKRGRSPLVRIGRALHAGGGPARSRRHTLTAAPACRRVHAGPAPEAAGAPKYVYCIIESSAPLRFGSIGIGAAASEVYTVHHRKLAAVVSDAPPEAIEHTRENLLAHERVNQAVMHEHTLIPMAFGTVFRTRGDVVELMRSTAKALGDVLDRMRNKLEFGLQVFWDRDRAVQELEREDEDIARLKQEIAAREGAAYLTRLEYGRAMDSALRSKADGYVLDVLKPLSEASVAWRINKPVGNGMIMNAAFLVERDAQAAFEAEVKSIAGRLDRLRFKYSGPWPAYNFVDIRLKLERA
ncbi:MAG TPA: GvpL/GvpF family gas vesicle protein [Burkholderiales bacterium]|nr:GvpL/GvpF family gas vesicle protein [Burkholderiales bacterium]